MHVREELGVDPHELPSPLVAAGASLVTFSVGALIPLLPYLAGANSLALALGCAAVAAVIGGGVVARLTSRPFIRGAARQLLLGAVAAAITYGIGHAVGTTVADRPAAAPGRGLPDVGAERLVDAAAGGRQQPQVGLDHHRDQLLELGGRLPAEPQPRLGRVRA